MKELPREDDQSSVNTMQEEVSYLAYRGLKMKEGKIALGSRYFSNLKDFKKYYKWINEFFLPAFIEKASSVEQKDKFTETSLKSLRNRMFNGFDERQSVIHKKFEEVKARDLSYLKEHSFDVVSVAIGIKSVSQKSAVYLDDLLSGCYYESEEFEISNVQAKQVVENMIRAVEEYTAGIDFEKTLQELPKPSDELISLYPVIVELKRSDEKSDIESLFDIFPNMLVNALPVCEYVNIFDKNGDKRFLKQRYTKDELSRFDYPKIKVNGQINSVIISPKNTSMNIEANTSTNYHFTGGSLKVDLSKTEFAGSEGGVKKYYFTDKYGNFIAVVTSDPWWNFFGETVFLISVRPNVFFVENGGDEFATLNIDLSPVGLGDYKNIFEFRTVPMRYTLNGKIAMYSPECYYEGVRVTGFNEVSNIHILAGIATAETMFNEKGLVKKIIFIKTYGIGFVQSHIKDTIFLDRTGVPNWQISFHEAVHLIDYKYGLSKHSSIQKIVGDYLEEEKRPVLCKIIGEKYYCDSDKIKEVSLWLKEEELIAMLCQSIFSPNIKERVAELSYEDKKAYKNELYALLTAIGDNIPNGKELKIYKKIEYALSAYF